MFRCEGFSPWRLTGSFKSMGNWYVPLCHRRRMTTEEKAKVAEGKNLYNSLPSQIFCLGRFWRIVWILSFKSSWCNSSYSSKSSQAKQLARQGIEKILPPPPKQKRRPFHLSLSFFYAFCFKSALRQGIRLLRFYQNVFRWGSTSVITQLSLSTTWT